MIFGRSPPFYLMQGNFRLINRRFLNCKDGVTSAYRDSTYSGITGIFYILLPMHHDRAFLTLLLKFDQSVNNPFNTLKSAI